MKTFIVSLRINKENFITDIELTNPRGSRLARNTSSQLSIKSGRTIQTLAFATEAEAIFVYDLCSQVWRSQRAICSAPLLV